MFTLTTDLDHILCRTESGEFARYWNALCRRSPQPTLIYLSEDDYEQAVERIEKLSLPVPAYIIAQRGHAIYSYQMRSLLPKWSSFIRNDATFNLYSCQKDYADCALSWLKYNYLPAFPTIVAGFTADDIQMYKSACDYGIVIASAQENLKGIMEHQRVYRTTKLGVQGLIEGVNHFISVIKSNSYYIVS